MGASNTDLTANKPDCAQNLLVAAVNKPANRAKVGANILLHIQSACRYRISTPVLTIERHRGLLLHTISYLLKSNVCLIDGRTRRSCSSSLKLLFKFRFKP